MSRSDRKCGNPFRKNGERQEHIEGAQEVQRTTGRSALNVRFLWDKVADMREGGSDGTQGEVFIRRPGLGRSIGA